MKLLDLFCGAGGCSRGYHDAGFDDITGVDINPQPHYPYKFIQADALEYLTEHGQEYDFIHASPPCQAFSVMCLCRPGLKENYNNLIEPTRELLIQTGKPYVIENVPKAPLISPLTLCGKYFGLKVYRHRLFETSFYILQPAHIMHRDNSPCACHGLSDKGFISVCGNGGLGIEGGMKYASYAMGIDWMTRKELSQAIPPAYAEYIGRQFMQLQEPLFTDEKVRNYE
jgi:DNA (cytosine-5)-methyltransferase 1